MALNIKQRILNLAKENNRPQDIALGVAGGVFIAITPLYGLHTLMAVLFMILVRRVNKISIFIGGTISIPPTLPVITWLGYNIGRFVLGKNYPDLHLADFKRLGLSLIYNFYFPLFLGSVILGLVCAVIFYFITLIFIEKRKKTQALSTKSNPA